MRPIGLGGSERVQVTVIGRRRTDLFRNQTSQSRTLGAEPMLREGGVSEPRAKQERGMKIPNNDLDAARLSPSDREAIEAVAIADILS